MDNPFKSLIEKRNQAITDHANLRASARWEEQEAYFDRVCMDFALAISSSWWACTRYKPMVDDSFVLRHADDILQSIVAIRQLVPEGAHNPARREQRYLLEAMTHYLLVDQDCPKETFDDRRKHYEKSVVSTYLHRSDELNLYMLDPADRQALKDEMSSDYKRLCGFVHPSVEQIDRRLLDAKRGFYAGHESVQSLEAISREVFRFFDVILALYLHAIGRDFCTDVFDQILIPHAKWKYHKGKYIKLIQKHLNR